VDVLSRSSGRLQAACATPLVGCAVIDQSNPPPVELDDELHVRPRQPDRLDREDVTGRCSIGPVYSDGRPARGATAAAPPE
jgi:hypothetical protein